MGRPANNAVATDTPIANESSSNKRAGQHGESERQQQQQQHERDVSTSEGGRERSSRGDAAPENGLKCTSNKPHRGPALPASKVSSQLSSHLPSLSRVDLLHRTDVVYSQGSCAHCGASYCTWTVLCVNAINNSINSSGWPTLPMRCRIALVTVAWFAESTLCFVVLLCDRLDKRTQDS
jgi:hypothetical protein